MLPSLYFVSLVAVSIAGLDHPVVKEPQSMSSQLFQIIEFYKQADPIGLPLGSIPDPMPIPPIKQSFGIDSIELGEVKAHGISKLRIKLFKAELSSMAFRIEVRLDEMLVSGSYILSSFMSRSSGPFRVVLKDVTADGNVTLGVAQDGLLQTDEVDFDFKFEDMSMNFENLGFVGKLFQSAINTVPKLIFDSIKPYMLREVDSQIQSEIDGWISEITAKLELVFPNSIPPLDLLIGEARMLLRRNRMDPFLIPDYNNSLSLIGVKLSHTWLRGLASFYREGDVSVTISNHTAKIGFGISTGKLKGSAQWEISLMTDILSRAGNILFTIDYLNVAIIVEQPLDLRRTPILNDLQLEMGNIQIYCHGAGSLDYLLEASVNILPNLLRPQIMNAIEMALRGRIQEKLRCMNVEQFIKSHVEHFERHGTAMAVDWRLCEKKIR